MINDFFQVSNIVNPFDGVFSDSKILSNNEKYIIYLYAPYVKSQSLCISIKEHILTIECNDPEHFYMRFMLPTDAIEESITAKYDCDAIQITIPRVNYEYSSI